MRPGFCKLDPSLRCLMLMAAIAPLAVTRTVSRPRWDDASYLHRAACFNRSFYDFSVHGIGACVGGMFRSPIMAFLLLPAGPLKPEMGQLNVAPFVLACVTFGLAVCVAWITFKAGAPLLAVAAAALAIWWCGPIETAVAPFLVDGAFALLVTIALLLPLLEHAAPAAEPRAAVFRGLLWGGIAGAGMLTKVTFVMFGVAVAPLILLVSFRRVGTKATLYKTAAASVMGVLPAAMFVRYGSMYLGNGWASSYGNLAQYYNDGLSPWGYLRHVIGTPGHWYWLICGCLLLTALIRGRHDFTRVTLALASVMIVFAYLLLASASLNREPRFLWPIWLVLPLAAAGAIVPSHDQPTLIPKFSAAPIFALAVLWSLPMLSRLDFHNVREADALLRFLRTDHPITIEIASDTANLNSDTLQLAQQVDWDNLSAINIRTVVYDMANGRPPEYSERQLRTADFVIFSWPVEIPPEPEFTNRFVSRFLATAWSCGRLMVDHPGPPDTLLFDMRYTACQTQGWP